MCHDRNSRNSGLKSLPCPVKLKKLKDLKDLTREKCMKYASIKFVLKTPKLVILNPRFLDARNTPNSGGAWLSRDKKGPLTSEFTASGIWPNESSLKPLSNIARAAARSVGCHVDDLDEMTDDIMFHLIGKYTRIAEARCPEALARTIARNYACDLRRRQTSVPQIAVSRLPQARNRKTGQPREEDPDSVLTASSGNGFASWWRSELRQRLFASILAGLQLLDDIEASILRGFYGFGCDGEPLSLQQLASVLPGQISIDAIKSRKRKALQKMKNYLTAQGFFED
jgi:DNA-directed RNA polymerase specialized sigma24 family protein